SIDWNAPPEGFLLRQDAGAGNALGQAILRFANPFAIYLHDTPSKRLFAQDQRATSSGCVRVEHIMELVRMLLEDTGTMQNDELRALLASGKTHKVELLETVPILIAYWTADVADNDDGGSALRFLPDIYQRDPALINLLEATEKRATRLPVYLTHLPPHV
ncbi:MAG: L,D-transpeptidase family protein, partial [Rhodocyclaceae bacterium]|nr:L,D-transpeptidase family protein [Rhodocyclaceae bacterium]